MSTVGITLEQQKMLCNRFLRASAHNNYVMSAPVLQNFMGAKGVKPEEFERFFADLDVDFSKDANAHEFLVGFARIYKETHPAALPVGAAAAPSMFGGTLVPSISQPLVASAGTVLTAKAVSKEPNVTSKEGGGVPPTVLPPSRAAAPSVFGGTLVSSISQPLVAPAGTVLTATVAPKEPQNKSTEPDVMSKEPYIPSKESYIPSKEGSNESRGLPSWFVNETHDWGLEERMKKSIDLLEKGIDPRKRQERNLEGQLRFEEARLAEIRDRDVMRNQTLHLMNVERAQALAQHHATLQHADLVLQHSELVLHHSDRVMQMRRRNGS
eukprot:CAMPEP_0179485346 /NCGR_PEP_ID=MMETSP0799-20121207/61984_1 /TAXON_ID=46947 /ORGANISM="Geminigera cryophila, Strain CCMP2564" /LENGTH=324 /DNA_ID=CAMNT_0021299681 /DNA_START=236 /DNA_END=1206 /DNA_ORIENTATION=+